MKDDLDRIIDRGVQVAQMIEMRRRVTMDPEATRIAHDIAIRTWRTMRTTNPITDEESERMLDLVDEYEARAAILMGRQPQERKR